MENKKAFGFTARFGHIETSLRNTCIYIIFAETYEEARKFVEKENEKFSGYKFFTLEDTNIKDIKNANIVVL